MCTAVHSIPGQSVAVTTATVIGARCEAVNTQLSRLARMTTIPLIWLPTRHQVAATSATLLFNTADTCIAMPFGFSIGEYLDNERSNYMCRLTQIYP
jgi:hypothetical protein